MEFDHPSLAVVLALAAGMISQVVARHLRIPGIVLLLLVGVLLGPELAGIIQPAELGDALQMLVGVAVAVILFEGGLNLNVSRLRKEGKVIRRLVTLGALITAVGGMLSAKLLLGWGWRVSILFGALVIVTGPTVVTPLLRRIRVNRNLHTILEAEGVLIDPIGAIIAVVALEAVITETTARDLLASLLELSTRLGFGFAVGLGGGLLIGWLLKREGVIPNGLENVFTLALVLALFEVSDALVHESGIMSVTVAGLVVGNMNTRVQRELQEFKEQLTVMLIGMLFVLLAADVRLEHVTVLGWPGVATVVALMTVVRGANVLACTAGTSTSVRERLFLSWMAPRGIVAAAVASLFANELTRAGIIGGNELRALVFLVIAATVTVQGLSGGVLASRLGVLAERSRGVLIVGANPLGRALAGTLRQHGEEVVLIDLNASECQAAEREGFSVLFGNANDESVLLRARAGSRRALAAVTSNDGLNLLLAQRVQREFAMPQTYVALERHTLGVHEPQVREANARVLFGSPVDIELWLHRLSHRSAAVESFKCGADPPEADSRPGRWRIDGAISAIVALSYVRSDRVELIHDGVRVRKGDLIHLLVARDYRDGAMAWMRARGWEHVEAPIPGDPPSPVEAGRTGEA